MLSWYRFLILSATILVAVPAFSLEWYKAYQKGQDKIKKGDCAEGQSLIMEALKGNPRSDLRAPTYGTFSIEYIPHFYLAQCAFQTGRFSDAQKYLKEAESARVATSSKAKEYAALKAGIDAALLKEKALKTIVTVPPPVVEKPVEQKPPPPVIEEKKPPPPPIQDVKRDNSLAIKTNVREARSALDQGRYSDARVAANRVLEMEPANVEARNVLNEIAKRQAAEFQAQEMQQKLRDAEKALRNGDLASAENQILALKIQYPSDASVRSLLNQIQKEKDSRLRDLKDEEYRRGIEKEVIVAYYRGAYDEAIRLAQQGLPRMPQSWRLHFFTGCSYAALSILAERGNEDHLRMARESFRRVRSLSGDISVPPHISPKILEIYRAS